MKKISALTRNDKLKIILILVIVLLGLFTLSVAPLQTKITCDNKIIIVNGTITQDDIYKYCNIQPKYKIKWNQSIS